jgi:hypothetical protein
MVSSGPRMENPPPAVVDARRLGVTGCWKRIEHR